MRFGFFAFFAFFLLLERLREVERLRLARRFLLDERFLVLLRGARGLLAVLRRDLERALLVDLFEPRGVALRRARFFEELRRRDDLERLAERLVDRERLAALGFEAVLRLELRLRDFERLRELLLLAEVEALRFGALGAAARRRAFLAFRLDALRFLDFLGARGLLAVRRRDLERDFLAPLGAAARWRFLEDDRLLEREREREVDFERDLDLEADRGLLADRRRDALLAFLTLRADLRLVDLLLDALRSRLPVNLSRTVFCPAW